MVQTQDAEDVLERAAHEARLTDSEVKQVRDFLTTVKTLGRIGRVILWAVITAGAIAAAVQQIREQL